MSLTVSCIGSCVRKRRAALVGMAESCVGVKEVVVETGDLL
jgi:hypothetical protein